MDSNITFYKILKLTNLSFLLIGLKLYDTQVFFNTKLWFIFNIFWIYSVVCAEIFWFIDGVQNGIEFSKLTYTIPCVTITLLGTAKNLCLFMDQEIIIQVVSRLRKLQPDLKTNIHARKMTDDDKKQNAIVLESMKYLNLIINFLFYTSCSVVFTFIVLPLIFVAYAHSVEGSMTMQYPLQCKYFFDTSSVSLAAAFAFFHQFWATIQVALSVFGPDTLFYACCTFLQMHFRILHVKLMSVVDHGTRSSERLRRLVIVHQELIDITQNLEYLYSKSMLLNVISSSLLICLSGFNVATNEDLATVLPFVTFLFMSLSQVFMLCYCGDMVVKTSGDICQAAYHSRWYDMDKDFRRSINIIIYRSLKPCKITAANFAVLNLGAYTTIISRSWSYFALLQTMYK